MIVCVCKRVSDSEIRRQVDDGARSFQEISRRLGVGTQCGKCVGCAHATVHQALADQCDAETGLDGLAPAV